MAMPWDSIAVAATLVMLLVAIVILLVRCVSWSLRLLDRFFNWCTSCWSMACVVVRPLVATVVVAMLVVPSHVAAMPVISGILHYRWEAKLAVVTALILIVGSTMGSTPNNHDDCKRKYGSKAAADRVVARMRSQGVPHAERLNSYFNEERNGWYVGKRWIIYHTLSTFKAWLFLQAGYDEPCSPLSRRWREQLFGRHVGGRILFKKKAGGRTKPSRDDDHGDMPAYDLDGIVEF
eukprot:7141162-Prymnesium_polylepis.1